MKDKEKWEKEQEKQQITEMYIKFDQNEVPEFQIRLRGYDRSEVDKYLNTLVDAYNEIYECYQTLKAELDGYRQNKDVIFDALVEAKITAAKIINEAKDQAYKIAPAMDTDTTATITEASPPNKKTPLSDDVSVHKDLNINELVKESKANTGG